MTHSERNHLVWMIRDRLAAVDEQTAHTVGAMVDRLCQLEYQRGRGEPNSSLTGPAWGEVVGVIAAEMDTYLETAPDDSTTALIRRWRNIIEEAT